MTKQCKGDMQGKGIVWQTEGESHNIFFSNKAHCTWAVISLRVGDFKLLNKTDGPRPRGCSHPSFGGGEQHNLRVFLNSCCFGQMFSAQWASQATRLSENDGSVLKFLIISTSTYDPYFILVLKHFCSVTTALSHSVAKE